jgi:hypothetical protein
VRCALDTQQVRTDALGDDPGAGHEGIAGRLAVRGGRVLPRTRDDELRKGRARERRQRHLSLPAGSFAHRRPRRTQTLRRRFERRHSDGLGGGSQPLLRRHRRHAGDRRPHALERGRDDGLASGDAMGGRLDQGQRAHPVWPRHRGQHGNDAAVRMSDEVRARPDERRDVLGVELVVAAVDVRAPAESPAVDDQQLGDVRQRALGRKAVLVGAPRHRAVHEDRSRGALAPVAPHGDVDSCGHPPIVEPHHPDTVAATDRGWRCATW